MKIGARLTAAVALLPKEGVIADVGCDHGKLAVSLSQTGYYRKIIATDISAPSLEKAKVLALRSGAPIECRLGSGLTTLNEEEADAIVMAGWGGLQILEAIRASEGIARKALLVLQPMAHAGELRKGLVQDGFGFVAETLCSASKGRLFEAFSMHFGVSTAQTDPFAIALGPLLIEQKHPLLTLKIDKRLKEAEATLCALSGRHTPRVSYIRSELLRETEKLKEVRQWLSAKTY